MSSNGDNKNGTDERNLNFLEKLYLPEILKALGYTFGKMRKPTVTVQYPEESWTPPDGYRGRPVLVEEDGQPRCVACGLCARSCPPMAISMQATETEDEKERTPDWFEINMLRCIYCGFCEEVCPEEAIVMSKEFDLTFQGRDEAHFGMERLLVPKAQVADRLEYLAGARNEQFGQKWDFQKENNHHSVRNRTSEAAETENVK